MFLLIHDDCTYSPLYMLDDCSA